MLEKLSLPLNKSGIEEISQQMVNSVNDGNEDPIHSILQLRAFKLLLDNIEKGIKATVIEDVEKYGKEGHKNITIREAGVKYDYSNCNCSEWNENNVKIKELQEANKKIEAMLKALPVSGMANTDTGEIMYPPSKSSTTSIVVTLDK